MLAHERRDSQDPSAIDSHFRFNGPLIEPLTPEGRVTVALLKINFPIRVSIRDNLLREGRWHQ